MEKPITLQVEDLKNNLVNAINQSKLPTFILNFIIKDIYIEINAAYQMQLGKELNDYNKLSEENYNEDESKI